MFSEVRTGLGDNSTLGAEGRLLIRKPTTSASVRPEESVAVTVMECKPAERDEVFNKRTPVEVADCVENSPSILETHEIETSLGTSSLSETVPSKRTKSPEVITSPFVGLVSV